MHPLIETKVKNYIFIGESGSGKTENILNFAKSMADEKYPVCLVDLDQTKPLFRARDVKDDLLKRGVSFVEGESFQDSPITPPGVSGALMDPGQLCLLDVGGNIIGARMLGQFRQYLKKENTCILYIMNSFRPFSDTPARMESVMSAILSSSGLQGFEIKILSNPNLGCETEIKDVFEGHRRNKLFGRIKGIPIAALAVRESLFNRSIYLFEKDRVIPLWQHISYA